jgi:amino acid adenylation domain-containing protein
MHSKSVVGFRLSPQQKTLWRTGGDHVSELFVQCVVSLEGQIESSELRRAVVALTRENEILRTSLNHPPGVEMPVQVIAEDAEPVFEEVDSRDLDARAAAERLESLIVEESRRGFDLDRAPLVRFCLFRPAAAEAKLLITASALICDTQGLCNLVSDLANPGRGAAAENGEEPIQYADLAEWQNGLLEEEDASEGLAFWQAVAAPPPEMPFGTVPGSDALHRPDVLRIVIDGSLAARIQAAIEGSDADASAFFLAGWQVLIARLTGLEEFSLGLDCDGRSYEELKPAIGLFARDLPFRCRVDLETRFADLLSGTRKTVAEMHEWQEYASPDGRFPIGFAWEGARAPVAFGAGRLRLERMNSWTGASKLRLVAGPTGGSFACAFHYDPERIDADDVRRLSRQFVALLTSAAANAGAGLGDLDMIDDEERALLLEVFNRTDAALPEVERIHDLIEAHAHHAPDRIAIVSAAGNLTYGELDRRAERLAAVLRQHGVGPDRLVGLSVDRSAELLVGILGILKASGAYVPMDPSYPADRLEFMLADSGADVLVTRKHLVERLPGNRATVICIDDEATNGAGTNGHGRKASADNLAYVIYTSGSTGTPKGVEITHRNLVHSTAARLAYYGSDPSTFLLLSSFAFDSSVAGIFGTLCGGGTLVLPPEGRERDLHTLQALIESHQVTATLMLPSLYNVLLSESRPEQLRSLRDVIVAGEACPPHLIDLHHEKLGKAALHNEYGPTEGTVWCTVCDLRSLPIGRKVPIGKPVANSRVYLLDDHLRPVPLGAPGELYIGGDGVARGYLNQPDLTAARFPADPFGTNGARLYRTGDLARFRPDGNVEYLGRVDNQVKIRGHRVELEEIEAVIKGHATVRDAAVSARENRSGDLQLVAYVVPAGDLETTEPVERFLQERLPEPMMPSAWIILGSLPLNANGKVDREALPDADSARAACPYEAPHTPVQEVLAGIWADVLGHERVGVNDNFLALGGNSLRVTQLNARIRDALQVELSLRTTFEKPTVAELAAYLLEDGTERPRVEKAAELFLELAELSDDELEAALDRTS